MEAHPEITSAFVDAFVHTMSTKNRNAFLRMLEARRFRPTKREYPAPPVEEEGYDRHGLYALDDDFDGLISSDRLRGEWKGPLVRIVDILDGRNEAARPEKQPETHREMRRRFYSMDANFGKVPATAFPELLFECEYVTLRDFEQHLRAHARSRKSTRALVSAAIDNLRTASSASPPSPPREGDCLYFRGDVSEARPPKKEEKLEFHRQSSRRVRRRRRAARCHLSLSTTPLLPAPLYIDFGGPVEFRLCVLFVEKKHPLNHSIKTVHAVLRSKSSDACYDAHLAVVSTKDEECRWCETPIISAASENDVKVTVFDTQFGSPLPASKVTLKVGDAEPKARETPREPLGS